MADVARSAPQKAPGDTTEQGPARKVGHFLWQLVQMVVALIAGMVVYMVLVGPLLGPTFMVAHPLLNYLGMFAFMTAPLVVLMRYHGYDWRLTTEMAGVVFGIPTVLVGLSVFVPVLSGEVLGQTAHIAMLVDLVAWMLYHRADVEQHLGHRRIQPSTGQMGATT
jgi:hypothetical protein